MSKIIRSHKELEVYKRAFAAAMEIFRVSQKFPKEEVYSLTEVGMIHNADSWVLPTKRPAPNK